MTNRDNPTGVDVAETTNSREVKTEGERLLSNLAEAIREKDLVKLRVSAEDIANRVQVGKVKCSNPVNDGDLRNIIDGKGGEMAYVGTGSFGSRIVIEEGKIYMPFGENEERMGYGKTERQAFKILFGIPESEYPSVSLPN